MAPSQAQNLTRLVRARKNYDITLEAIAAEAARTTTKWRRDRATGRKRRTVGITTVSKVLAGRTKSQNIVDALARLVSRAEATRPC